MNPFLFDLTLQFTDLQPYATAMMQLHPHIKSRALRRWILFLMAVFSILVVACRLLSGAHCLNDIIGGVLLSAGLVFSAVAHREQEKC